jgi:hypothetical protein
LGEMIIGGKIEVLEEETPRQCYFVNRPAVKS